MASRLFQAAKRPIDVAAPAREVGHPRPDQPLVGGVGLGCRQPFEDLQSSRRVAELVVDRLQAAKRFQANVVGRGRLGRRRAVQNGRLDFTTELAVLGAGGAHQELDSSLVDGRGAGGGSQPARQGRRIVAHLGELSQPILDLAVVGHQGEQRNILLQRTGDVAARAPPLSAVAAQRLQPLAVRKSDRHGQQLRHARRAPRGVQPTPKRVQHLQPRVGRGTFIDEDLLQPLRDARR